MSDLAHLKIWDDPAIRDSLSWYLEVAENRRPAKFRIASTLATQIDPVASSEQALWAELDRLTPILNILPQPSVGLELRLKPRDRIAFRINVNVLDHPWSRNSSPL